MFASVKLAVPREIYGVANKRTLFEECMIMYRNSAPVPSIGTLNRREHRIRIRYRTKS